MDEGSMSRRTLLPVVASVLGSAALRSARFTIPRLGTPNADDGGVPPDVHGKLNAMAPHSYASLPGVYNVKDYGAKGDGATNDAPAIAAAVAAVPKQGGIIYFPPGVYLLNSSVLVQARTDLSFVGA